MGRNFVRMAALLALLAVALGAFGAHGLKAILSAEQLHTFEIGVRYQFYHSLGLFLVGLLFFQKTSRWLRYAGNAFIGGILLFSGSLYLLACNSVLGIESWKWLGPITPLGGLLFILGWLFIFIAFSKKTEL